MYYPGTHLGYSSNIGYFTKEKINKYKETMERINTKKDCVAFYTVERLQQIYAKYFQLKNCSKGMTM